ncbi:hypothetical protein SKAU_G00036990 [Synaphobranchus kaupii]|uniref:Uncharacterized protein n=1 Tax=Synaphobranchus kaupii TaxID=118154 RepID=A0A9Q1GEQ9_SYNKA|nr:hypothetical protein SKAU_G00036990 [Synaphobranchus kaupii]
MDNNLQSILCNGTLLEFNSTADKETFQRVSCSLTPGELRETRRAFQQNLDAQKLASAISKLQNSMLFNAANSLDFRSDMMGSINLMLCGKEPDVNSTNSRNISTSGFMTNFTYNETQNNNSTNNNSSAFCQTLVDILENTPGLRYVWSTFQPLLQGKVLYTPDTVSTSLIVKEANNTFHAIAMLKELAEAWGIHGHKIWDFMQDSSQMNSMRTLLNNPGDRPPGAPARDWRDSFNSTSEILAMLAQFIGCFDLDKFQAVPTEANLVEESLRLLKEEKFWAGIVFEDIDPQASDPPALVKYKIRMDIDEVERTNKAEDRSWSPGARDHSYNDLRYVWGGFAYLQDMIDHGIIRTHTAKSQPKFPMFVGVIKTG